MDKKKKKNINKFDLIFFSVSALLILVIAFRIHDLTPTSVISTFLLVISAPFIYKYIEKKYGEEKKSEIKLNTIDNMSEKELGNKIASLYTGRGFAIRPYDSDERGIHLVCQRKGVRNGEDFLEKGLVLIIHTTDLIDYKEFLTFLSEMKSEGATQGMMVTNSRFSPEIIDEASAHKVALWSRAELREKFHI